MFEERHWQNSWIEWSWVYLHSSNWVWQAGKWCLQTRERIFEVQRSWLHRWPQEPSWIEAVHMRCTFPLHFQNWNIADCQNTIIPNGLEKFLLGFIGSRRPVSNDWYLVIIFLTIPQPFLICPATGPYSKSPKSHDFFLQNKLVTCLPAHSYL